jgi:hypothetical protein
MYISPALRLLCFYASVYDDQPTYLLLTAHVYPSRHRPMYLSVAIVSITKAKIPLILTTIQMCVPAMRFHQPPTQDTP